MRIEFEAPDHVHAAIAQLGRSEDVRFSPSNKRLAIVGFAANAILVLDVELQGTLDSRRVCATGFVEIKSSVLARPHGVDFLDENTIAVANRGGKVPIFQIPERGSPLSNVELAPTRLIGGGLFRRIDTPGSVCARQLDNGHFELLICNNLVHQVTRHTVDTKAGYKCGSHSTLLEKGLDLPDGIAVDTAGQWLAISNHDTHSVFLYDRTRTLGPSSEPDGTLTGANFPHGLRFSADDRYLLVADAGSRFVHAYDNNNNGWSGALEPIASVPVMAIETYFSGRINEMEGGPKGVDIDNDMTLIVTTCETQPLAFFDLAQVLNWSHPQFGFAVG